MKKFSKIMVFVLMFVLSVASIIISPITVFAAAPLTVGVSIMLTKIPTKGTVNTVVKIPVGTSTSGSTLSVKITDPKGKEVALPEILDGYYQLVPTMVGDYKVQYSAKVGEEKSTTSSVYTIRVTGSKATLSFDSNTAFLLPEKVGKDSVLVLPYPNITDENDNTVVGNYTGEGDNVVSVTATDPNHNVLTLGTIKMKSGEAQKTYYKFAPTTDANISGDDKTLYGTYSVTYKYSNNLGVAVTKSSKINVSPNYSTENQDITFTWSGSLPTSAVLGKEVTLPTPVTVDKNRNNESVKTFTKVEVQYVNGTEKVDFDVDSQKFTFTPTKEAKSGSFYTITYKIYTLESLKFANIKDTQTLDKYLDTITPTLVREYSLNNVTDTVAPTPVAVSDYAKQEDGTLSEATIESLKNVDISNTIPSKAAINKDIDIPAIYATDNYDAYKNLTLTRSVLTEDKNSYSLDSNIDNDICKVVSSGKLNEKSTINFKNKGTYTIRYRATDASGNSSEVSYNIVVSDTLADNIAPYITLPTIQSSVVPGEEISFGLPTVVDYSLDHATNPTDSTIVDTKVKTNVYYYYGKYDESKSFEENTAGKEVKELSVDEDDNTIYKFEIPSDTTNKQVTVVVRAEDDAKYANANEANNVSYAYRTINIYSVNDEVMPTIKTTLSELDFAKDTNGGANAYGQNEEVTIPEIKFTDTDSNDTQTAKSLITSLTVLDKNGNNINISGVKYVYDSNVLTMKDGKFITTVAGKYQIVITATDMGGNSLINSVFIDVKDNKAPVIELTSIPTTMELGQTYKLPNAVLVDDGEKITNSADMEVEVSGPGSGFINHETLEFTPKEKGTYNIVYHGKDASGNEVVSNTYTVSVKDTIKPVIVLDESTGGVPATAEYKDASGKAIAVSLPSFSATDEYNGINTQNVTVTDPDGDAITVDDKTDHYEFTPNQNGTYKVVYKAVDLAGNEQTMEFSIDIGDCQAPKISISSANKPGTYYIGDQLSLDLSGIKVTDNNSTDNSNFENITNSIKNGKVTIVLTKPDNTTVTFPQNDTYKFKFETAGTYTLTYTAKDSAGNSDPLVYSFEVKSKTNDTTVSEQTWGIVLIVVSLALLCGVVIYFVKTKDAPTEKLEKAKELAKKKKSDK